MYPTPGRDIRRCRPEWNRVGGGSQSISALCDQVRHSEGTKLDLELSIAFSIRPSIFRCTSGSAYPTAQPHPPLRRGTGLISSELRVHMHTWAVDAHSSQGISIKSQGLCCAGLIRHRMLSRALLFHRAHLRKLPISRAEWSVRSRPRSRCESRCLDEQDGTIPGQTAWNRGPVVCCRSPQCPRVKSGRAKIGAEHLGGGGALMSPSETVCTQILARHRHCNLRAQSSITSDGFPQQWDFSQNPSPIQGPCAVSACQLIRHSFE